MSPWLQTASGRAFHLCDPTPAMVDFAVDVPEALARIPRFTGHISAGPYSVAQHSVMGADAIIREIGDSFVAAAFLLHDAHEAYIGDIATPIGWALGELAHRGFVHKGGYDASYIVRDSLKALKLGIDAAVYRAAGFDWPLPGVTRKLIADYDLRMLQTERLHLLGPAPAPWDAAIEAARPIALGGILRVWSWPHAADQFRDRLRRWLGDALLAAPSPPRNGGSTWPQRRLVQVAGGES